MFNTFKFLPLVVLMALLFAMPLHAVEATAQNTQAKEAPKKSSETWTIWAKRAGRSETDHVQAIAQLRREKNLSEKLIRALDTPDRSLALDVISALAMKDLASHLLAHLSSDNDGFLTLTLSSLLDEENKNFILNTYIESLRPETVTTFSPATIIAMLEPLGRIGMKLPKKTLTNLFAHEFPEVRSASLSYLRQMVLQHGNRDHDALITEALSAREFQLRLQTISLLTEMTRQPGLKNPPLSQDELTTRCQNERNTKIRTQCLSFVQKKKGKQLWLASGQN